MKDYEKRDEMYDEMRVQAERAEVRAENAKYSPKVNVGTIGGGANAGSSAPKHVFGSGASSSTEKPRYDLVPLTALRRLAERFGYGARKHGDHNYRKGLFDVAFIRDRQNHMIEHAVKYAQGDRSADHLGAVMCNAAILADLEDMQAQTNCGQGSAVGMSALFASGDAVARPLESEPGYRERRQIERAKAAAADAMLNQCGSDVSPSTPRSTW